MTKVYAVRGTGYPIDGMLVVIKGENGDNMCSVLPYNKKQEVAVSSILVHKRYLQEVSDQIDNYTYKIKIEKYCDSTDASEVVDLSYNGNVNAKLKSISDFIDNNLSSILGK
jgi:hypothetical protein